MCVIRTDRNIFAIQEHDNRIAKMFLSVQIREEFTVNFCIAVLAIQNLTCVTIFDFCLAQKRYLCACPASFHRTHGYLHHTCVRILRIVGNSARIL